MYASFLARTRCVWTLTVLGLLALTLAPVTPVSAASRPHITPARSTTFDRQFIDMMVPHHQGAVAMAQLALQHSQHAKLRQLAHAIISSQDREITQMKTWRKAWFGSATTPPMSHMMMLPGMSMSMSMNMPREIQKLRTAHPFDRAFLDAMVPHHQSAVAAARLELNRGMHGALKALARSIIADQNREIAEMKTWRKAWYGKAGMSGIGS